MNSIVRCNCGEPFTGLLPHTGERVEAAIACQCAADSQHLTALIKFVSLHRGHGGFGVKVQHDQMVTRERVVSTTDPAGETA